MQAKPSSLFANVKLEISADEAFSLIGQGMAFPLDVRAANEFLTGHIPFAQNFPILTDGERVEVGKTYKQQGKEAAIALGENITKEQRYSRIDNWKKYLKKSSTPILYCARGGLRSIIAQNWLVENGFECFRVRKGYKALRRYCIDILEKPFPAILLGGFTGSRKTKFLHQMRLNHPFFAKKFIDLELLANHRGSAFGKIISTQGNDQPKIANFENSLAMEIYSKYHSQPVSMRESLIFEDESKTIGKIRIPNTFYESLAKAPLLFLEVPFEERVRNIFEDYILEPLEQHSPSLVYQYFSQALSSISPKLGHERFTITTNLLKKGFENADMTAHYEWIEILLRDYYDPMYSFASKKKQRKIFASGSAKQLEEFFLKKF